MTGQPIVHTAGRSMTLHLQRAIDDITGDERRRVIAALADSGSPVLGVVHRALALELHLADLREADLLRQLEAEQQSSMQEPPLPAPPTDGTAWWPEGGAA